MPGKSCPLRAKIEPIAVAIIAFLAVAVMSAPGPTAVPDAAIFRFSGGRIIQRGQGTPIFLCVLTGLMVSYLR